MSVSTGLLENGRVDGKPLLDVWKFFFTTVVKTSFIIFWIKDESWVSTNNNSLGIVYGAIELSDNYVSIIFVCYFREDWTYTLINRQSYFLKYSIVNYSLYIIMVPNRWNKISDLRCYLFLKIHILANSILCFYLKRNVKIKKLRKYIHELNITVCW